MTHMFRHMTIALAALLALGFTARSAEVGVPAHSTAEARAAVQMLRLEREESFSYQLRRPERPGPRTLVLLHGSGGDETTLMPLARQIAPDAVLLGVRGRVRQEGINRWYTRLTPTSFDQADVLAEAEAFVAFLKQTSGELQLDLEGAVFVGYSNGANLIAVLSLLHPEMIRHAVLLRAMPVLDQAPEARLVDAGILTIAGRGDTLYGPYGPAVEELFRARGARVKAHVIDSDHGIGEEDARLVREWLTAEKLY